MLYIDYTKLTIGVYPDLDNVKAEQIRGYIGYLMLDDSGFSHHSDKLIYEYPKVQYRIINGEIVIIGLKEYSNKIYILLDKLKSLIINKEYKIRYIKVENIKFLIDKEFSTYKFITPWLALNEINYRNFKNLDTKNKKDLLGRILIGNILSFLKGMDIHLDFKLVSQVSKFKTYTVYVNKNKFEGIKCKFMVNLTLPDFIGLGKSVSKGYGSIFRCKNDIRDNR